MDTNESVKQLTMAELYAAYETSGGSPVHTLPDVMNFLAQLDTRLSKAITDLLAEKARLRETVLDREGERDALVEDTKRMSAEIARLRDQRDTFAAQCETMEAENARYDAIAAENAELRDALGDIKSIYDDEAFSLGSRCSLMFERADSTLKDLDTN